MMALLLTAQDVEGLVSMADAIEIIEAIAREELAGTTVHMAPFGGAHARPPGLPPARPGSASPRESGVLRAVGGGAYGLGWVGVRVGGMSLVYATEGNRLLGIVGAGYSNLRVGAFIGLAARYLARANAHSVGLLGSGRLALPALEGLCAVRPIERVAVYSPTPAHRAAFAERAGQALGIPVTAVDTTEAATKGADIVAVGTSSPAPVVAADHIQPGTHVTSWGEPNELDRSIYRCASQVVVSSWRLEEEAINPSGQYATQRKGLGPAPLWQLLNEGELARDAPVELGSVVAGQVAPRAGSRDITVFRESQGGAGDIALAGLAFERARALGRGIEFQF